MKKLKLSIGVQDFPCMIEDGYKYVDKTDLVYKMANEGKAYFLSRPRRFGKSLLCSTLGAYFEGRRELFNGLMIEAEAFCGFSKASYFDWNQFYRWEIGLGAREIDHFEFELYYVEHVGLTPPAKRGIPTLL